MKSKLYSYFYSIKFCFLLIVFFLLSNFTSVAQTILPQKLGYPRICANIPNIDYPSGYNRYEVFFKISGFPANETFFVLLSDDKGSFTTPIKPKIIPNGAAPNPPADTPTDKTLTFEVPSDLVGSDIYGLKIQSSSGVVSQLFKTSDLQSSFPIYFLSYSGTFYINNKSDSLSFCNGGSVTLSVDNSTPSIPDSSPLQYPQLKYNWYKNGVLVPNETKSSLSVNQAGEYYVEVNYGPCSDINTRSQSVKVSGASGSGAVISSSSGNPFCSSLGSTILSVSSGNSYVWRRDNTVIDGAISSNYITNLPGTYTCDVDFGGCKSTGTIDLNVFEINSSISGVDVDVVDGDIDGDGDKDVDVDGDNDIDDKDDKFGVNYISEGETVFVTATTSAVSPSYQWFINGVIFSGETKSSLDITAPGKYKLIITQNSGCNIVNVFLFEVSFRVKLKAPEISNIVTSDNFWVIPDIYTIDSPDYPKIKTNIVILNSNGEIVYETNDYNNYKGWPELDKPIKFNNFNPVYYYIITPNGSSAKKGSITLVK
jgi:hypothetical protein